MAVPEIASKKLKNFWQSKLDTMDSKTMSIDVVDSPTIAQNFSKTEEHAEPDLKDPYAKPIGIPPPKTLREAKLSPWWPYYKQAAGVEFDGQKKAGTFEVIPRRIVPKGKNILRGKWVFDDKRGWPDHKI